MTPDSNRQEGTSQFQSETSMGFKTFVEGTSRGKFQSPDPKKEKFQGHNRLVDQQNRLIDKHNLRK